MNFLRKDRSFTTNSLVFKKISQQTMPIKFVRNHSESTRWWQIACGLFIDLEKAFETVSHDILLEKLDYCGIRGISNDRFRSYLSDRSQFVSINGFNSDYKTIKYGVPQGSVLGPLLFLIFINDFNTATKHSETFHFADDTCLLNIKDSDKQINKVVKKDLKFPVQWLNAKRISPNVAKTKIFNFRRKKKHLDSDLNLKLCGKKFKPSNYIRYLGIYLDEYLYWSPILTISAKS